MTLSEALCPSHGETGGITFTVKACETDLKDGWEKKEA